MQNIYDQTQQKKRKDKIADCKMENIICILKLFEKMQLAEFMNNEIKRIKIN